jgi:aspartyl-tRNA(Asn)/glutamyl-tRNA(Gln) amidotransferase subunit A
MAVPETTQTLTLTDAAAALRNGETTSVELTKEALALADRLDETLGVYLARFDDYALERAAAADAELAAGSDLGPLHGIPIGVKDILAMAEGPTTAQSLVLDPAWGEGKDAIVVERLKAAGAVITGKLTTMEFACAVPDPDKPFPLPRNPWDTDTWPGGSSSGSGAGVAAGMFYAAVGTDTGGSIRIPAIFCGTSGLMPTFGRVPNAGCAPLGYSLDHIGPLARSARDCGAFLAAISGPDPRDPYTVDRPVPAGLTELPSVGDAPLAGVRVGVARQMMADGDDPAVAPAFDAAVAALRDLGAEVVEVTIPHYDLTLVAMMVTCTSEALAYHMPDLRSRPGDYFRALREMQPLGATFSGADYVQAQRVRRVAQRTLAEVFAGVDLIATPAASVVSPSYEKLLNGGALSVLDGVHTAYWDAVGNPALVVPMGFNGDGLPLSLQLAARPFEEDLLVRAGDAFQHATDWHLRVPPLAAEAAVAA